MALPFGVSIGEAVVGSGAIAVSAGAAKILGGRIADWWYQRREKRRERVHEWHREMHELLSEVRSVGRRIQTGRHIDVEAVEELIPATVTLDARVNPPPVAVTRMVHPDVVEKVLQAAGLAYHLAHLPSPDEGADSIAGVMRHQYELLQRLGSDTDVKLETVLEIIGELNQPDNLDITKGEADQILDEFEAEARRELGDFEDMTVDEMMELPWEMVDDVVTAEARQAIIENSIDQYYEIALLNKPREARSALKQSEENLFS